MKQINNYILPYKLGQARLIQKRHDFIYKIEAENLFKNVNVLMQHIKRVNDTLNNKTRPQSFTIGYRYIKNLNFTRQLNEGQVKSTYSLIAQTVRSISQTENKLKTIFPEFIRNKRSPLNIVGNAANWLFGIMDNEEKKRIDATLEQLYINQENLRKQQECSMSILKSIANRLTETFKEVQNNQIMISKRINSLATILEQIEFLEMVKDANELIIQNNNIMLNILTEIQDAIIFSSMNKVHPSILTTDEIREINYQLKSLYNPNQLLVFKNTFNYYMYFSIQNYISSKEVIFRVSVPILFESIYNLYHIYAIPYNNHIIPIAQPYLLTADSTYALERQLCPKLEDVYICGEEPVPHDNSCVLNLMKNNDICEKISVYLKDTLVQQIGQAELLIYTPNKVKIFYNCSEIGILEVIDNVLLKLKPNCVIQVNNERFYFQKELIKGEIFNLPKINTNIYDVKQINSIHLNKINVNSYTRIKEDIQNLKLPHLEKIVNNNSKINYFVIGIIIVIIICVISFKYCKILFYRRFRNSQPPAVLSDDSRTEPF